MRSTCCGGVVDVSVRAPPTTYPLPIRRSIAARVSPRFTPAIDRSSTIVLVIVTASALPVDTQARAAVTARILPTRAGRTPGSRQPAGSAGARPPLEAVDSIELVVPEAPIEETPEGLHPVPPGWFVVNGREARWRRRPGRGHSVPFTGWSDEECETHFRQIGIGMVVVEPGEPTGMYHWEN